MPPSPANATPLPRSLHRAIVGLAVAGLLLAAAAGVAAVLAGLGHRWGWWAFHTGFSILRYSMYVGVLGAAAAGLAVLPALVSRHWRSAVACFAALAVAAVVVGVPWQSLKRARSVPPIHDITTDTVRPPEFHALLEARTEAPNLSGYGGENVAYRQRQYYPDIGPALFDAPRDQVFAAVQMVADEMEWRVALADPEAGRMEATATTFWFGFKDDVIVRLSEQNGRTRVDVRSVSRVGTSDLGTNADRIREFLRRLRARVEA